MYYAYDVYNYTALDCSKIKYFPSERLTYVSNEDSLVSLILIISIQ